MSAKNIQKKTKKLENLPEQWEQLLIKLCKIPATSKNEKEICIFLFDYLKKYNPIIDEAGNIIVSKGEGLKPCFTAHLDTVHKYEDKNIFYYVDNGHKYFISKDNKGNKNGIGGDDKAGILVCLYLLEQLENIKIVFFTGEEAGCIGSSEINLNEFKDCTCIISIDRWGNSDYINWYCGEKTTSNNFDAVLSKVNKKYNRKSTEGFITDAFTLFERNVNLSCINVSCGYYKHHTNDEYIDLNELYEACLYCVDIVAELSGARYEHKYVDKYISLYNYDRYGVEDNYTYVEKNWTLSYYLSEYTDEELKTPFIQDKILMDIFDNEGQCFEREDIEGYMANISKGNIF